MATVNQNDIPTDESGLRFYGIGIVTENKPRNTDFIMVSPIEKVSATNGRLADVENIFDVESLDVNGIVSKETVTGQADIKAKWFPLSEGNRQTAPDVREGETVRLWKYGNTSEYYWQTMYREPAIRRLETVLYCYGNLPKGNTPWDKDSSYWMEVSTHDQHWWWKSTQSNGEAFGYDIKLDTKESTYRINDSVGNMWLLDSANTLIRFYNVDGTFVDLDKDKYWGYSQTHMKHESKVIHMKTPKFIVTGKSEGDYHKGAFTMVDEEANTVQFGAGNDSNVHMTDGVMTVYSNQSIDERTQDKTIQSETRRIQARTLTESYGRVHRTTGSVSESLDSFERSAGSAKEDYGTNEKTVGEAKETYGSQDKTADKIREKIKDQTTEVDKLDQTSKDQSIKSDKMKEEYKSHSLTVDDKEEYFKTISTVVEEKEDRQVGDYLLISERKVDIRSNEGILLTDATISNLSVPGKLVLGGKDIGGALQDATESAGDTNSKLEALSDRTSKLEQSLDKAKDEASAIMEEAGKTSEKLDGLGQTLDDTTGRVSATEDELGSLGTRTATIEEKLEDVLLRLVDQETQMEQLQAKAKELTDTLDEVGTLAEAAKKKADDAYTLAEEAKALAEAAMAAAEAAASAAAAASEAAAAASDAAAGGATP